MVGANTVRPSKKQTHGNNIMGYNQNLSYHTCRGRRPRRPAPLDVSTAISFVLSAQCCSAQILDNLNLVTSSGTSHFCETEIEPFPNNVLVNFLLPQNRSARCLCTTLISYAHSSLLIPHSSFILALSAIHRSYLRQSLRQSIIKLIKAFQSPLPVRSHC